MRGSAVGSVPGSYPGGRQFESGPRYWSRADECVRRGESFERECDVRMDTRSDCGCVRLAHHRAGVDCDFRRCWRIVFLLGAGVGFY